MPLNTLRLNHQKSSHPNDRVVFIKPLPRPPSEQASYDLADTFLRAIAAQCLPIMKDHYLSVTTLEEYEPNPEFIGRNFNNGEIIQLVLQSKSGGWVPFNMVQMVMMHELAHNTHMNHGRDFWKTRNLYAEEMKALWAKNYTGEGFWGSGRTLSDMGAVMGNRVLHSRELEGLPLCGGTYRSRTRKRKARGGAGTKDLTWKEKRDRRIEKKFGKNGVALGEDEDKRLRLEINRTGPLGGKPRVAQSKRGRELRAAAALARFETNKQEAADIQQEEQQETDEGDYEDADADQEDATDVDGNRMLDSHGHGMIRVCGDEDTNNIDVQHEMRELGILDRYFRPIQQGRTKDGNLENGLGADSGGYEALSNGSPKSDTNNRQSVAQPLELTSQSEESSNSTIGPSSPTSKLSEPDEAPTPPSVTTQSAAPPATTTLKTTRPTPSPTSPSTSQTSSLPPSSTIACPICSLENPRLNASCLACSHVLDPRKDPRHWTCQSQACKKSGIKYLNSGDAGVCGLCGARKEA